MIENLFKINLQQFIVHGNTTEPKSSMRLDKNHDPTLFKSVENAVFFFMYSISNEMYSLSAKHEKHGDKKM